MMRIDILTLFPEMFHEVLDKSIIGRAQKNEIIEINYVQIRDFAYNKHRQVDDYPYGGGMGMIMQAEPIFLAHQNVCENIGKKPKTIYLSPQGKVFRQGMAKKLSKEENLILLCGHYEGIDQRVLDEIVDMELSIGDFVMTGGEIAAMAVVDTIVRLLPGVLAGEEAYSEESHYNGLLEYPQYTRPEIWHDKCVPDILLSGHHRKIEAWKREMSIKNTFYKRRGLLTKAKLTDDEKNMINAMRSDEIAKKLKVDNK